MTNDLNASITSERVMRTIYEKSTMFRVRLAAISMAIAGILFVLYPSLRPFSDETSLLGAEAFSSTEWIVSHVLAILGFILLTLGLFGLYIALKETTVEKIAFYGFLFSWLGVSLTLPYYGAEVFGLHAIGQEAIRLHSTALVSLANVIRFGPGFILILVGLLLLAFGSILSAAAIWKSHIMPKWSGIPFAIGFLLYIPQFLATQPIRVAHGLVVTIGCLWIAAGVWRKTIK